MKPLGIRNNNPLNIRFSVLNNWKGQTGSNRGFCTFESFYFGYRAAAILLKTYFRKGYVTISSIIERWAPRSENNTKAYIKHVLRWLNDSRIEGEDPFTPDTDLTKYPTTRFWVIISILFDAMTEMECGDVFACLDRDSTKRLFNGNSDAVYDVFKDFEN